MGMVIFKSGGMMFKHKNKFFFLSRNTIYLFLIFFLFLGGVELVDAPRSCCVLDLCGPTK